MNADRGLATFALALLIAASGCGGTEVTSDEQARRAYLGLDRAVGKSLQLGFAGFNAATSANIPAQSTTGDKAGTLAVSGQVDQGTSANKEMRLRVGMTAYTDGSISVDDETIDVAYQTTEDVTLQPALELSLRSIPTGTFSGTLVGPFEMSGDDLTGTVTLNLTMSGELEPDDAGGVRRKAGTTTVTGTATSAGDGEYQVDATL